MAKVHSSDLIFNCPSSFPFTRTTLPPKIIQLRKQSQENHVRRMKFAYKMKEMRGVFDISKCLSSSFPRKSFGNVKSSTVTPTTVQSCSGDMQNKKEETIKLLPAKINSAVTRKSFSNSFNNNSKKKITATNMVQKRSLFTEKEQSVNSSHSNKDENNNMKCELMSRSSTFVVNQKDAGDGDNRKIISVRNKPSRIPILKSRLQNKEKVLFRKENLIKNVKESLKPAMKDVENQFKELKLQETSGKEKDNLCFEESYALPNLLINFQEDDMCERKHDTFHEPEKLPNNISLIDKWMNGALDITGSGENSVESSPISKFLNNARISSSQVNNTLFNLIRNKTPEHVDIEKDSTVSSKYDYITGLSESEKSSEVYYVLEDASEGNIKKDNVNNWQNMNFDDESTITVPSDKDLEVSDYRDSIYKNLPDYPNTPYNLRYPRLRFKDYDKIFNSLELETNDNANRTSGVKNRRKCYSATPKRVKSAKRKKTKRQNVRKKDTFTLL